MKPKDWGTLFVDILNIIVEYHIKDLKEKYSSQINKLKKKRKIPKI